MGGNRKAMYTEGWIEFTRKKVAKRVAESLNNTPIGGPKGSFYREDRWNLKFLKHFKWSHLTEKIGTSMVGHRSAGSVCLCSCACAVGGVSPRCRHVWCV